MPTKKDAGLAPGRPARGLLSAIRLLSVVAFLCLCAAPPALGQVTTYSDSWFVDNSGSTPADEGSPETESTVNSYLGQNQVAAVGVTEADYNSGSMSVQTTLTSPTGATASGTSYEYEWYTRTEVALPYTVDVNDRSEQNWRITTGHYYWVEEPYSEPCGPYTICPMEQQVSYKPGAPQYGYRRYYFFPIDWLITISISGQGYRGLVIQPPYGVRPYRCLYTQRTCYGSACGSIYGRMLFLAFAPVVCQEYLQVYFLRVRYGFRTSCIPLYGISTSVPGECF